MSGEPGSDGTFRRRRRPDSSLTSFRKATSGLVPEDLIRDMILERLRLEKTSVMRVSLW
jgi:hypothetical protein